MKQSSFFYRVKKDWMRNRSLYLMIIPVLIFFILFHYKPMYGAIIAFKDYTPALGIAESPWVGWDNFTRFFSSVYFGRLIRNTILFSFYSLLFGFPAPIILALLLNEVNQHSCYNNHRNEMRKICNGLCLSLEFFVFNFIQ